MGAPGDSAPHCGQLQALRTCQERDLLEAAGGAGLGTLGRSGKAGGAGQIGAGWQGVVGKRTRSPEERRRGWGRVGAPRVLEFWSTRAETSRQRFLGAPGSGKTVPGTPPFFPRERTPCIALSSSSCSSVLWSFFLSVSLSLSQPLRLACPLIRYLWSCPSAAGLPGSASFPASESIRASPGCPICVSLQP